ncbi:MAG TPA: PQQ-dependent sugar dehydrogenase [Gammaproteobacteria bacterium]|nr:PQQ-dependent sugar dehydrogenase [Gammaproteobacteria bacterium]
MKRPLLVTALVSVLSAVAAPNVLAQPRPARPVLLPAAGKPLTLEAGGQKVRVALVAGGLVGPWDLAFLPDGKTILVTESPGRLRIIRDGMLDPQPLWTVPSPPRGNDVLHGLAVHPDFAENHFVYVSYAKTGDKGITLAVARGRLENGKLSDMHDIFVADAWDSTTIAIAGRMLFGPDNMLYVTVGDRDRLCCVAKDDNSLRMKAQDLGTDVGKTLRITADGGIPKDNPFVGRPNVRPEIFTYGHRNGYGLAFRPGTDELWEIEIGPMGGDELNVLKPGHNYGWPLVSLGRNYSGTLVSDHPWFRPGMDMPRMYWEPAITPSGLAFYTGDRFPKWKGDMFVGALSGELVERIALGQPREAELRQPMLTRLGVRFRDVEQGPEGDLYVTTEVRYGTSSPDGAILRIEPAE